MNSKYGSALHNIHLKHFKNMTSDQQSDALMQQVSGCGLDRNEVNFSVYPLAFKVPWIAKYMRQSENWEALKYGIHRITE